MSTIPRTGREHTRNAATVLLVDDDGPMRELLAELLALEGYRILESVSGMTAPALAQRFRPDAILLDLELPGRSGTAVLESLQEDQSTHDLPVIVLTGHPDWLPPEDRHGLVVLPKPPDFRVLLDQLGELAPPPDRRAPTRTSAAAARETRPHGGGGASVEGRRDALLARIFAGPLRSDL